MVEEFLSERLAVPFDQLIEKLADQVVRNRHRDSGLSWTQARHEPLQKQQCQPADRAGGREVEVGQLLGVVEQRHTLGADLGVEAESLFEDSLLAALVAAEPVAFVVGEVVDVYDGRLDETPTHAVTRAPGPGSAARAMRSGAEVACPTGH